MGILDQVTTTTQQTGQRILIAGVEKVGKSTLACTAPGALLIPLEVGNASIKVPHTPQLETWAQVETLCQELIAGAKSGRIQRGSSIVWDSATALERIIHNHVIATDPDVAKGNAKNANMETVHGSYGKGYAVANGYFERWTRYNDELAMYGGINIIITCHVFASLVVDPAFGEYHSWDLLLHSPKNLRTYGKREFMTQWVDFLGFMHEPMFVQKAEKGQQLVKAVDARQGVMLAVDRTPGWVAGNRYGLTGLIPQPEPQPGQLAIQGWNNLAWAIHNNTGIDLFNRSVR